MLLSPSRIHFSPAMVPTVAALFAFCLMLFLGHWQQGRAAEKQALQNEFNDRILSAPIQLAANTKDGALLKYSMAVAHGEWDSSGQIYIDNKFDHDAVGFHVITPLTLAGTTRQILVNRGWVARTRTYPQPPTIAVPNGPVTVEGMLTLPSAKFLELSSTTIQGNVWQNLTLDRYARETGRKVVPFLLLQKDASAPLRSVAERPDARVEKHVEYMLTWYSLAATVVVLWIGLNIKLVRAKPQALQTTDGNIT
ncbi:MAG: SURF1 family protein [Betaproteobacteria bacterium]